MVPRFPAVVTALALLLTVGSATGCGGKKEALGGGKDVDLCVGYKELDGLSEPPPSDKSEVERFAAGYLRILDRIDIEFKIRQPDGDRITLPKAVQTDLATLKSSMTLFRDAIDKGLAQAHELITRDKAFAQADAQLATFAATNCKR